MNSVKRAFLLWGMGVLAVICLLQGAISPVAAYDRTAAWDYAFSWYNSYNPGYQNYVNQSFEQEDANFVAQALIAGGLLQDATKLSLVDPSGSIYFRGVLHDYLLLHEHAEKTVGDPMPSNFWPGDVVFFGEDIVNAGIVGIYAGNNVGGEPLIATHNLTGPPAGALRSLGEMILVYGKPHYFHFTRPEETQEHQSFYGTGSFYGPGALSAQVIRPGDNYLGYVLSNTGHSSQDMAIATDTSQPQFKGCSYLISGYCCDPGKHVPAVGQGLGQPWTSDSPFDWAYWVRKAVVYAVHNGSEPWQVRDAIWYITTRVGFPNDITEAINFPPEIPIKQELRNGSFEAAGRIPPPWTGSKLTSVDGRVRKVAHSGKCSFRMAGNKSTKTVKQTINVSGTAGDSYTLSAWSKALNPLANGGPYELRIKIFYEGGGHKTYNRAFKKNSHQWQQRKVTFTIGQNYSKIEVSLVYSKQGGTVWFDDVELIDQRLAAAANTMEVSAEKR
jgi:hypothetical protein